MAEFILSTNLPSDWFFLVLFHGALGGHGTRRPLNVSNVLVVQQSRTRGDRHIGAPPATSRCGCQHSRTATQGLGLLNNLSLLVGMHPGCRFGLEFHDLSFNRHVSLHPHLWRLTGHHTDLDSMLRPASFPSLEISCPWASRWQRSFFWEPGSRRRLV